MNKCIVFAPIAEREVHFYLAFADFAKKMQWPFEVQFISFYQSGNKLIEQRGFKVWDIYAWAHKDSLFQVARGEIEAHFNIENLHKLILHEKLTFGILRDEELDLKFYRYLNALNLILKEINKSFKTENVFVFQELGGFVAPLSLMYAAKTLQIRHVFFEPAFFKGTMNFIENSFVSSFKSLSDITEPIEPEAVRYLDEVRRTRQLVIPQKDRHHYQDMDLAKLFNCSNFKKLFKKMYLKYVKNEKQEYEHISNHVARNVRQFFNRKKTAGLYSKELPDHPFIYFPFHVRLDVQLTIRNPEYLNQLAFVEFVAQILPKKYKIVIKEHPASIGGFNSAELKRILSTNDNIVLLQPMINTYEILQKSDAVITINSKVGAEALSLGQLVACMGHGFYWNSEVVNKFSSNTELMKWLEDLAHGRLKKNSNEDIEKYFSEIYRQSYRFELYNHSEENLKAFFTAIQGYVLEK
jgi:hypothetical protein